MSIDFGTPDNSWYEIFRFWYAKGNNLAASGNNLAKRLFIRICDELWHIKRLVLLFFSFLFLLWITKISVDCLIAFDTNMIKQIELGKDINKEVNPQSQWYSKEVDTKKFGYSKPSIHSEVILKKLGYSKIDTHILHRTQKINTLRNIGVRWNISVKWNIKLVDGN